MTSRILAGVYDDYELAQITAKELESADVPYADISILTSNSDGRAGAIDTPPGGEAGAAAGAAAGTVLGAGAGLLAGISLFALPAIGPIAVAGWLMTTLVGVGAGASLGSAAGGLVGSLIEAGLTKEEAHFYAETVRRGGTILLVRTNEAHIDLVTSILHHHSPVERIAREQEYRTAGWSEFDETAPAYTTEQMIFDREIRNPYRGPQL